MPVEIRTTDLSDEALQGLLEEFVSRDGTDYGESELSLEERVARLRTALDRREAIILFDEHSGTTQIVTPDHWQDK